MTGGLPGTGSSETRVITVRYWAAARAATGNATETVPVPGPMTLAELTRVLVARHPAAERVLGVCSVLVGDQPVRSADPAGVLLEPGTTVEFLPPFAGG
jgi:molybdopterin synthase sulfur carrier subunit